MLPPLSEPVLSALLEQSRWARHLATRLVHDDAAADDLTQEAFLSVLRSPPDPGRPLRPWLAQVLCNLVCMRFRGDSRRTGREAAGQPDDEAQDDFLDSPEALLARTQARRMLTDCVVRQHIQEVKRCDDTQLEKTPSLSGKVQVRFVVVPDGTVAESSIVESSRGNADAEKCIEKAARGWQFPKPQGGRLVVVYPFVLAPSGT